MEAVGCVDVDVGDVDDVVVVVAVGAVVALGADAEVVAVPYAVVAGRDALARLRRAVDRPLSQEGSQAGLVAAGRCHACAEPAPVHFLISLMPRSWANPLTQHLNYYNPRQGAMVGKLVSLE